MYMHYQHHDASYTPPQPHRKKLHPGAEDGSNPYAANRPPPRPRGNKVPRPLATNVGFMPRPHVQTSSSVEEGSKDTELANAAKRLARTVTHLKAIQLHIMSKDSLTNKASLITNMFQLRVLSGATKGEGGHTTNKGVELIRGRKKLAAVEIAKGYTVWCQSDAQGGQDVRLFGDTHRVCSPPFARVGRRRHASA